MINIADISNKWWRRLALCSTFPGAFVLIIVLTFVAELCEGCDTFLKTWKGE
jgi:hypothetical protein